MIDRVALEEREERELSEFAAKSAKSRGRRVSQEKDPLRTEFQRDRDRILHCKAFRRLSHKTQVFLGAKGDHYRTRLTHTLEVSQVSRTIARALALNEDLTEAIALGHDLGHTPYGHSGETALREVLEKARGAERIDGKHHFSHNEQSLRVVDVIENNGRGLNLTEEVRDGILHHRGKERAFTLEGRIVAIADRIAYINHDIDDSIRAGVISESDLPDSTKELLGRSHSERITTLVNAVVEASDGRDDILMVPEIGEAMDELRDFLFERVYKQPAAKSEEPRAITLIKSLFEYYLSHISEVPEELRAISGGDDIVAVIDYIAGMTDRFAVQRFEELFVPKEFNG